MYLGARVEYGRSSRFDGVKVLIYGINFAPEPIGVGKYSGEIAHYLASCGADVRVVTAPPHYPGWRTQPPYNPFLYKRETQNGIRIMRCPLVLHKSMRGAWRVLAPLSFALTSAPIALLSALLYRPHAVLAVEPTLFAAPMALLAARMSGARAVLHVQDLDVEAAFAVAYLGKSTWLARIATFFDQYCFRRFDHIISISTKMIERIEAKGVAPKSISLIRNWVDISHIFPTAESPYRRELGYVETDFLVLYSGNMGIKQGLGSLLEAAEALKDHPHIKFVIAGEGPAKKVLIRRFGKLPNVRFLPLQPYERLNDFLNLADLHALPQDKGVADLVLPSKLGGMLATGRRIMAVAEPGTELAAYLGDTTDVVPPGDPAVLTAAIRSAFETKEPQARRSARLALAAELSHKRSLAALANVLVPPIRPRGERADTAKEASYHNDVDQPAHSLPKTV